MIFDNIDYYFCTIGGFFFAAFGLLVYFLYRKLQNIIFEIRFEKYGTVMSWTRFLLTSMKFWIAIGILFVIYLAVSSACFFFSVSFVALVLPIAIGIFAGIVSGSLSDMFQFCFNFFEGFGLWIGETMFVLAFPLEFVWKNPNLVIGSLLFGSLYLFFLWTVSFIRRKYIEKKKRNYNRKLIEKEDKMIEKRKAEIEGNLAREEEIGFRGEESDCESDSENMRKRRDQEDDEKEDEEPVIPYHEKTSEDNCTPQAFVCGQNFGEPNPLHFPWSDCCRMSWRLKQLGYSVDELMYREKEQKLTYDDFKRSFDNFLRKVKKGSQVVFYFSGHGFQDKSGKNFIQCVKTEDGQSKDMEVSWIMEELRKKGSKNIMLLDCCQVNIKKYALKNSKAMSIDPHNGDFVVGFACLPGKIAIEKGAFGGGVFTHYILKHLKKEKDILQILTKANIQMFREHDIRGYFRSSAAEHMYV